MTRRMIAGALLLWALLSGRGAAQTGGPYSLEWNTVDGGGQTFGSGGGYVIGGTAGQPDAAIAAGGGYALGGGFWVPGVGSVVAVSPADPVPLAFASRLPQPNPFRSSTTLDFELPAARTVMLVIHDINGRVVRRLAEGTYEAGVHHTIWDGRDDRGRPVVSGIYFAHLVAGEFRSTVRIIRVS
jgi:flagellar hook capping protein FlgD